MDYIVYDKNSNILSRHFTAVQARVWMEKEIRKWEIYGMIPPYMELHYNGIGYNADKTVTFDSSGNEVV